MAILLAEAGLLDRTTIYATDIDAESLKVATSAIYPAESMITATRNYQASGGDRPFSDWYTAKYDRCILSPELRPRLEFFSHNLATDSAFGNFTHLVPAMYSSTSRRVCSAEQNCCSAKAWPRSAIWSSVRERD